MNQEQLKSVARSIGMLVGGIAVGKGWISTDQLHFLLSDQGLAVIGAVLSLGAGVWGWLSHTPAATVAAAAALPEVAAVAVEPTPAGVALAAKVSEKVASTPDAVVVVSQSKSSAL